MTKDNILSEDSYLAVIRLKGDIKIDKDIKDAFTYLNLKKRNWCTVIKNTPSNLGQLNKVKDYSTYGVIDSQTLSLLVEKKGEIYTAPEKCRKGKIEYKRFIVINGKKYKKYFRLTPPIGGFEVKGTKRGFGEGGSLGNRSNEINDLIKKMI
ncbi:MAG: uL30 family ribosomal protein [archaeon]